MDGQHQCVFIANGESHCAPDLWSRVPVRHQMRGSRRYRTVC